MNSTQAIQRTREVLRRTFWDRLREFSPIVCRLLARHPHGPPLSDKEIALRSGLTHLTVVVLSDELSWDGVKVATMRAFIQACNLDFEDKRQMRRVEAYLRALKSGKINKKFAYLERSPDYESYYLPLRARYEEHCRRNK